MGSSRDIPRPGRPERGGYVMLVALVLFGVLSAVGAMVLTISGSDQRIAFHQQRYLSSRYAAHAAVQHGRFYLMFNQPSEDGWAATSTLGYAPAAITVTWAPDDTDEVDWTKGYGTVVPGYTTYLQYQGCGGSPAGFSAEMGSRNEFRTDFWRVTGEASWDTSALENSSKARSRALVSKVTKGPCMAGR